MAITNLSKIPIPPKDTNALGIFQGDIIVGSALRYGLADLRANPWLLDYAWASLPADAATARKYGEKTRQDAKDWFRANEILVLVNQFPPENPPKTCLTVHLMPSSETESRLGDVHYVPSEPAEAVSPALTAKFNPEYDSIGGEVTPGEDLGITPSTAMSLVDAVGNTFPILSVAAASFFIQPGFHDLRGSYLRPTLPTFAVSLESSGWQESYQIGVHALGEPVYLTYLHSIVLLILLRYRASLLEARGLQRTNLSTGAPSLMANLDPTSPYYTRAITLSGFVEQFWPAAASERLLSSELRNTFSGLGEDEARPVPDEEEDEGNLSDGDPEQNL